MHHTTAIDGLKIPTQPTARPTDAQLLELAARHPEHAFPRHGSLAGAANAHYTNTRWQLAYALNQPFNSLEGDVRMRDGVPVMAHDSDAPAELTFEQWAAVAARSGRMLRIDLKESRALPAVLDIVDRLGIPHDRLAFNASALVPRLASKLSLAQLRSLRARMPDSWITLNLPLPASPGYALIGTVARHVGGHVGVALQAQLATEGAVRQLKQYGVVVSVWNHPPIYEPRDIAAESARLRALGIDGQIDLRRRDDPLADD